MRNPRCPLLVGVARRDLILCLHWNDTLRPQGRLDSWSRQQEWDEPLAWRVRTLRRYGRFDSATRPMSTFDKHRIISQSKDRVHLAIPLPLAEDSKGYSYTFSCEFFRHKSGLACVGDFGSVIWTAGSWARDAPVQSLIEWAAGLNGSHELEKIRSSYRRPRQWPTIEEIRFMHEALYRAHVLGRQQQDPQLDPLEVLHRIFRGNIFVVGKGLTRAQAAKRLTGYGSTYSVLLCRMLGLDPDEKAPLK